MQSEGSGAEPLPFFYQGKISLHLICNYCFVGETNSLHSLKKICVFAAVMIKLTHEKCNRLYGCFLYDIFAAATNHTHLEA
jgi:hypothetical protein